jgi:hypothetical protein
VVPDEFSNAHVHLSLRILPLKLLGCPKSYSTRVHDSRGERESLQKVFARGRVICVEQKGLKEKSQPVVALLVFGGQPAGWWKRLGALKTS